MVRAWYRVCLCVGSAVLAQQHSPIGAELQQPEVRQSVDGLLETTLTVAPFEYVGPHVTIMTRAFDGMLPGPTLMIRAGDALRILVDNTLGTQYPYNESMHNTFHFPNTTNLHTHGLHIGSETPGDNVFDHIEPLSQRQYEYEIISDHAAGTHWYHPHYHGSTMLQVAGGMAGVLIVQDEPGSLPPEIEAMTEVVMILQHFDVSGTTTTAEASLDELYDATYTISAPDFPYGEYDSYYMINGMFHPTIKLQPGEFQRWRIVQAGHALSVELVLPGCEMYVLATDGIWRPPQRTENFEICSGGRVDLAVRCLEEGEYIFMSEPDEDRTWLGQTGRFTGVLASVEVSGVPRADAVPVTVPALPDYLPDLMDVSGEDVAFHDLEFDGPPFVIGGEAFKDKDAFLLEAEVNRIQEMTVIDPTTRSHPWHMHINHFQIITHDDEARIGQWHDVTSLVTQGNFTARFVPHLFLGTAVVHCHILAHEDTGMMHTFRIVSSNCSGVECPPLGECWEDGVCDHGVCQNTRKPDGDPCLAVEDGTCQEGNCVASCEGVQCAPPAQCFLQGECLTSTGSCSTPFVPAHTPCLLDTGDDTEGYCSSGRCVQASQLIGGMLQMPEERHAVDGVLSTHLAFGSFEYRGPHVNVVSRAFENSLPAPTLRLSAGDKLTVTLENLLVHSPDQRSGPNGFGVPNSTALLFHGLYATRPRAEDVNGTEIPSALVCVEGGTHRTYTLDIPSDHAPGIHWYRSGCHGSSSLSTLVGAAGLIIINDNHEQLPENLQGLKEVVMLLQHIDLRGGSLPQIVAESGDELSAVDFTVPETEFQPAEYRSFVLINGMYQPKLTMAPGEWQRWRVANGGITHVIELAMPRSCTGLLLAADGVYLPGPRVLSAPLVMAPGARADVAIMCPETGEFDIRSSPSVDNNGWLGQAPRLSVMLAVLEVVGDFINMTQPDATPNPPAYLVDLNGTDVTEAIVSVCDVPDRGLAVGGQGSICKPYESASKGLFNASLPLDQVYEWTIVNRGGRSISFHIVGIRFQVVKHPLTSNEGLWKDTLALSALRPPDDAVIIRFSVSHGGPALLEATRLTSRDEGVLATLYFNRRTPHNVPWEGWNTVLLAVGAAVVVLVIVACAWRVCRKKRSAAGPSHERSPLVGDTQE